MAGGWVTSLRRSYKEWLFFKIRLAAEGGLEKMVSMRVASRISVLVTGAGCVRMMLDCRRKGVAVVWQGSVIPMGRDDQKFCLAPWAHSFQASFFSIK